MREEKAPDILDSLKVKNPCHESWDKMGGDERKRFCAQCSHVVNNLSEMTREESESLVKNASAERICVRYEKNTDGSIKFKSNKEAYWQGASIFFASALVLFGLQASPIAQGLSPQASEGKSISQVAEVTMGAPVLMGEIAVKTPSPDPTPLPKHTPPCHTDDTKPLPQHTMGVILKQ